MPKTRASTPELPPLLSHVYSPPDRRIARAFSAELAQRAVPFPMPTVTRSQLPTLFRRQKAERKLARQRSTEVPVRRPAIAPGGGGSSIAPAAGSFEPRVTEFIADITQFPYTAIGKMFFVDQNGDMFVGSAWVIGRRSFATAAHCLFDSEGSQDFYDNITFVPGFDGDGQAVQIAAVESAVHPNYQSEAFPEQLRWDIGVGIVDHDLIADFGALGYDASGSISVQEIEAIGYPAERRPIHRSQNAGQTDSENFPFDGSSMWHSIGDFLGAAADLHGMENEMTGGCSGGPWVTVDDHVAIGLNSHRMVPHDNRMFSMKTFCSCWSGWRKRARFSRSGTGLYRQS
jgi:V8-like Glu-specific endopeptidase